MFANSKKQTLAMHSFAVANVALELFKKLNIQQTTATKKTFENIEAIKEAVFLSGLLHDLGKVDENFQNFLLKKTVTDLENSVTDGVHFLAKKENDPFSFQNYPRHNEISWALCTYLFEGSGIRTSQNIEYAVYFHHAKIKRTNAKSDEIVWSNSEIFEKVSNCGRRSKIINPLKSLLEDFVSLCSNSEFSSIVKTLATKVDDFNIDGNVKKPQKFIFDAVSQMNYKAENIEKKDLKEITNLLVRSLVVSADRIVSSLPVKSLEEFVSDGDWDLLVKDFNQEDTSLLSKIENMLDAFSVRNEGNPSNTKRDKDQKETADLLAAKTDVATLFGPAGCGKTKIFLQWYANKFQKDKSPNKKLFIIAPRKLICSSLFDELRKDYIPKAKIEMLTGDGKVFWNGENESLLSLDKNDAVSSEVVITTIDQLISVMFSHKKIDLLLEFLNSYVVFDEFHEFFNISGIVIIFKLFMKLKRFLPDSKTLLVSATPNYYFVEKVLGIPVNKSVVYIDTFNKEDFTFNYSFYGRGFTDENQGIKASLLYEPKKPGSIVIFNTATNSQKSTLYSTNEDVINFHSKFIGKDRKEIYKEIIANWKHKVPVATKVLRAGPIVQASLNISTLDLFTEVCSAENWCQRLGRLNRFGASVDEAIMTTVVNSATLEGGSSNESTFLTRIAMKNQTVAWNKYFLNRNWGAGMSLEEVVRTPIKLKLSEIYEQYRDFHGQEETVKAYASDFEKVVEDSMKTFISEDFTPYEFFKPVIKKKQKQKMSSVSIRGKSIYVLPVRFQWESKSLGSWLYNPSDETPPDEAISISENEINHKEYLFNNQKRCLNGGRISGFTEASYANEKIYKNIGNNRIKSEAKNLTSPLLLSYPKEVYELHILNSNGAIYYVTYGKVKVGLLEIDLEKKD